MSFRGKKCDLPSSNPRQFFCFFGFFWLKLLNAVSALGEMKRDRKDRRKYKKREQEVLGPPPHTPSSVAAEILG